MPEKRSYLLVPAAGAGEGVGHLQRCLRLARQLGPRVAILTTRMDSPARALLSRDARAAGGKARLAVLDRMVPGAHWDLVVVDARRTTREELEVLLRHGPVVCLDEGGEAAALAPFLVDTIPGLPGARCANVSSPLYLDLPPHPGRRTPHRQRRILISFGGEDRANLTPRLLDALQRMGAALSQVTVVEGPLFARHAWPDAVHVLRSPPALGGLLKDYDLLFTHFGITAFEALASGVPVVLFNPSAYHARLGEAGGFFSVGTGRPEPARLRRVLADTKALQPQVRAFLRQRAKAGGPQLARLLSGLHPRGSAACPVCGRQGNTVIARFQDRTYRRCIGCGIIFLESFAREQKSYGPSYFSSQYKAQYGRTYLDDFSTIKAACAPRVRALRELVGAGPRGVVVDVGCAYGPFLAALADKGLTGFGLDVSPGAVAWVRRHLKREALCASFEEVERRHLPGTIAAVTMWYVIEHFTDTDLVLRKAASFLSSGGVLAFSTPNGRGVSARKNLGEFLRNSPSDHFIILSPRGLGRLLARYGLVLRRVRITGHHPERFPGLLGAMARRWGPARAALMATSRFLGLGDTFEAYAVKGEL